MNAASDAHTEVGAEQRVLMQRGCGLRGIMVTDS
jgi:hypothetical protein